ncbi:RagB/SusD family nutrient uptake outer membrane protein [Flavobacterium circumlabens]|uniref:Outer membrane starch-binding protein n=1 Tax=Flavobacterium circumlabens TaxID=2133765 RepID=A0A4Y7U765_9FLAO|nr:RagB/SusD family nutrient uptake outer membrane protein [Flavobacterium circumlabens]TCN51485.1 putative outer membrane starch-binding protein [Flavobacterium circumlabens]TEB42081.1 RagB/SusD family nutrient uptake outer membrane protein [Flavobacterium circumlabens]
MKIYKINFKSLALIALLALSASCSEDYLDRPTQDGYVSDNFYTSDEQVQRTTYGMYGRMWAPFFTKCFFALSEMSSGNCWSNVDGNEVIQFKLTSDSFILSDPWRSCFGIVAQSNDLINNLNTNAKAGVSPDVIKNTIAEAHFFRAVSYFYLVRLFGPVPIIEDNLALAKNPMVNNNRIEDVYKFIENDLKYAAANLKSKVRLRGSSTVNVFVSQGTAEAFLAKIYLYKKDYTNARAMAEKVINSGEFGLLPNYGDLFLTSKNNNEESIYSWQWSGAVNEYQAGNPSNVQYGLDILNDNASYGAVYTPTNDIQQAFEVGDVRRKESYIIYGDTLPNIKAADSLGFVVSKKKFPNILDATGAAVKKYVVGQATGETGPADKWGSMSNCNYIMRYADVLLIHAEAILAGANETSDPNAKESFNKIRRRAGLSELNTNTPLTKKALFQERRVEFAFEGEFWYDLGRLPRAEAIDLISKQDRGSDYEGVKHYTPVETDFIFPKPANDVRKNPKLKEAPVPYVFK